MKRRTLYAQERVAVTQYNNTKSYVMNRQYDQLMTVCLQCLKILRKQCTQLKQALIIKTSANLRQKQCTQYQNKH